MKLMTLQQYAKMSKPALIKKINLVLRATSKEKLARLCYNLTKSKLPRLSIKKRKKLKRIYTSPIPRMIVRGEKLADPYGLRGVKYTRTRSRGLIRQIPAGGGKRKFSKKQLAAQRLFAKRARAGTLRKRRR